MSDVVDRPRPKRRRSRNVEKVRNIDPLANWAYSPIIMSEHERHEAANETTIRRQLPPLPDGLSWPTDDFDKGSQHFGKRGGIASYLKEVWKPLLPYIDMPTMRSHYPRTAKAIDNHRLNLPPELLPPTKPELINRKAADIPNPSERPWHVQHALRMRAYRARKNSKSFP